MSNMNITMGQLKKLIKECACETMKEMGLDMEPSSIKIVKLDQPTISSGLFPGLAHDHHDDHDAFGHGHTDHDHDDQGEKSMILSNLAKIADKSAELRDMADQVSDNEEWVQEKIAVAASMIDSVHGYLKYTGKE
jgi:hypothetical protein